MKLSDLKINGRAKHDGDWVDIPDLKGLKIKTRGEECVPYRRAREQALLKARRDLKLVTGEPLPGDVVETIELECRIAHCLIDVAGLDDENGEAMPFDRARIRELALDPDYQRLADAIRYAAWSVGEKWAKVVEDAAKN